MVEDIKIKVIKRKDIPKSHISKLRAFLYEVSELKENEWVEFEKFNQIFVYSLYSSIKLGKLKNKVKVVKLQHKNKIEALAICKCTKRRVPHEIKKDIFRKVKNGKIFKSYNCKSAKTKGWRCHSSFE